MFASLETKLSFRQRKVDNDDDTEARAGAHLFFNFSMTICHQMTVRKIAWDANLKVKELSQILLGVTTSLFFKANFHNSAF